MRPAFLFQMALLPIVAASWTPPNRTCASHAYGTSDNFTEFAINWTSCLRQDIGSACVTSASSTHIKEQLQIGFFSGHGENSRSGPLTMRPAFLFQMALLPIVAASWTPPNRTCASHAYGTSDNFTEFAINWTSCLRQDIGSACVTSASSTHIKEQLQIGFFSGHGENSRSGPLTMRPAFLFQVSFVGSYRSDERGVVVVPCPRTLIALAYECFDVCKLLLCGDVELNPGPTNAEMLQTLIQGQQAIRDDLAELKNRLEVAEKSVSSFSTRMTKLETNVREIARKMDNFETLNNSVEKIQQTLMLQQEKLTELEDRSRMSNLVVFGIDERANETENVLRQKVIKEVFEDRLGVKCLSVARIHRLGKRPGKRPVILFFQNYTEKQEVLRNCKKLKGTQISVQNDFSADTLRKRKLLWQSAKVEKEQGKRVALVKDKLRVDSQFYAWDDVSNTRVVVRSGKDPTQTA
ncbi:uncharacterized protein LOC119395575 [Rhipicephalus sanguineus]|uniref:uncharacterized protein LOC119395575 n=1 Tax=Rhipicephalus sanguineus TaxID=34632 RepID=UPI00189303D0|nr:uncharacterized protein LOC119395575 [Rhipicephalus sanguineus]